MGLFKWEFSKIWRKRSARIVLFICVGYALLISVYNAVVELSASGTTADGLEEISLQYGYAEQYRGELTEDKLLAAYRSLRTAYSEKNSVYKDGERVPSGEAWREYVVPLGYMQYVLRRLYWLIPEYSGINSITEVPEGMVADFYAVRDKIVADLINSKVPDERDRTFLLNMNAEIDRPFYYDWYEGHSIYLQKFAPLPIIIAAAAAVTAAPVFASEYQLRTDSLVLSSRHGRRRLAAAKLLAAFASVTFMYLLCTAVYMGGQMIFLGTRGLNCPIQLINENAVAPMTIWQAELYTAALGYFSCVSSAFFTLAVSAAARTVFPAFTASAAAIFVPQIFGWAASDSVITAVIPFMRDYRELFGINMYFHIWSPYIMAVSPLIIAAAAVPTAIAKFSGHQVRE